MKKILALLLTFVLVFSLAACGDKGSSGAKEDGVLDVCFASEPQTMDPALSSAVDGAIMLSQIFEGLIKYADDGKGNAILKPGMAESWDISDDKLTYTFHLRDAKWSDGEPVTAYDFEYSWNRLANPETAADYSYMVDMVAGYDEKNPNLQIKAIDDKTFEVKLANLCPYFEEVCAFPALFPVRKDIVEGNPTWTNKPETYISNGPMKLEKWDHNSKITFVPNENYYDQDVIKVKKMNFHLMDDQNAMLAAMKSGKLDLINNFPPEEMKGLLADGSVVPYEYVGIYYISFNTQKAPFNDPRVRKAFSLAIDRNFIVNEVSGGGEVPATGFVPDGVFDVDGVNGDDFRTVGGDYYSVKDSDYEKNCEEARKLLAEAGFPDGEGFPVVEYLYNTDDKHKAIAEALQDMWQNELGVKVTLQNQDWAVVLKARKDGDFTIARDGWIADYNDAMSFIDMFLTGGGNNNAQYANPAFDTIVKKAKATEDPAERMQLMHDAEDMVIGEDMAASPLYYYVNPVMSNPKMKNWLYTATGFFYLYGTTGV